ncbi:MAG: hypothetical protein ACOYLX_11530 [Burkholderiaceae bacterium]|jgi:predicted amidophosphoribosyltransferase
MKNEPEIYCPACRWKPRFDSRWACTPACGAHWNTFWTGGVCPSCAHPWQKTQCLSCGAVSPHKAWYHFPTPAGTTPAKRERVARRAG